MNGGPTGAPGTGKEKRKAAALPGHPQLVEGSNRTAKPKVPINKGGPNNSSRRKLMRETFGLLFSHLIGFGICAAVLEDLL